ncbi:MAG: D-isomer specific 2-hydroxyacid dehydrogenase family protein [Eubacteriales bacterium]
MKIIAFEVREDEREFFEKLKVEIILVNEKLTSSNISLCKGADGVSILGMSKMNAEILDKLKELGIKKLSTRTIGMDHIDVDYAEKIGISVGNSSYPPTSVAEFTIMLMLVVLRNYKPSIYRGQVNDFSLAGLRGRTLKHMTVGVIGTGQIGKCVIDLLSGFGCKIIAYDPYPIQDTDNLFEYVDLETLYKNSDIITIHAPYVKENHYFINYEQIEQMKDGVIIINAARGELINTQAVIKGIESEKIGGLALDTIENESGLVHIDHKVNILKNRDMAYLRQFPNVVVTPHFAFYTDDATKNMVEKSILFLTESSS